METRIDGSSLNLKDQVVSINRVTKVVKGGKNLSFSALVVVGDENGVVGYGNGKAKEVPQAIRKALESAKKNLIKIPILGTTIPHLVVGRFCSGKSVAEAGTGRHWSNCRRTCACRHSIGGNSECADEVPGKRQSPQRREGDHRRVEAVARCRWRGQTAWKIKGRDSTQIVL